MFSTLQKSKKNSMKRIKIDAVARIINEKSRQLISPHMILNIYQSYSKKFMASY